MSSCSDSSNDLGATAFGRVFAAFEPFGRSFAPTVARKLLIYETNPFGLGDDELLALMSAADNEDLACVFVCAEQPEPGQENPNLYTLSPLGVQSYRHTLEPWTIVSHAIFPPSGAWGVMTTNESYVVVGGSEPFIERLLRALGRDEDEMIAAWLNYWADVQERAPEASAETAAWVSDQLAHIAGPQRAERALQASRLRVDH
jgi:hypothetical protein